MILGKGGCDNNSPGIGDVAFVKDLMTETVATHSFRCSKFGVAHSPESVIGWVFILCTLARIIAPKNFTLLAEVNYKMLRTLKNIFIGLVMIYSLCYTEKFMWSDEFWNIKFYYFQTMMNSCLKKPCEKGFAFYHGVPIQLDHSGAFRYTQNFTDSDFFKKQTDFCFRFAIDLCAYLIKINYGKS